MHRFRSLPVLVALGLAALLGPGGPTWADASTWRRTFAEKNDPDELYIAIEAARNSKDPAAAGPLLETALVAEHPHLSVACGEALRAIGPAATKDRDVQKAIAAGAKAKDDNKQKALARVLTAWGAPELDEELAALASGRRSPEVQTESLFACGRLGRRPKEFPELKLVVLGALQKGRTPEIRLAACSAAGWLGLGEAVEELASLVRRTNDDYMGLYAVLALQRIGWSQGVGSFLHVLASGSSDDAKRACLKAVVELAGTEDVPDLLSLSRHSQKDYRDAAALALARLAWQGRSLAPGTTPGDGGKGLPVLPAVIDRLLEMVEDDPDWEVRDAARLALLRIGEPAREKVRVKLPPLVEFSEDDTAQNAMELCGRFQAPEAARTLSRVALGEGDRTRRMFAARALETVDPEGFVKEVQEAVRPRPKAKDTELWAVRALGYVRHRASFDALVGMLEAGDWSPEIEREIEFALERLTAHRFGAKRAALWKAWYAKHPDPLHPHGKANDRMANRSTASAKGLYGLTRETERCVEDGLRFLEMHQHPGGWWDGNEKGFGGVVHCEPAYTGLAALAFLGAGYTPAGGKHCETVRRALEFLSATQYYDGSFPVTGGGDDSWIYAYLISMAVWGLNEAYAGSLTKDEPLGDAVLRRASQAGVDYLVRVQTPGGGWRYSARMVQSDTSCTSWVLMTLKTASLAGLDVPARAYDGIDSWLERCSFDITGETETPADLATDYDYEVGSRRRFKSFVGYFELSGKEGKALQQTSMTAVGMVCRFFMGWKRSHPFQIGCANFLRTDYLPQWMVGLEQNQALAWYHYYWYYGTLAMYQMGGQYWKAWNDKIRRMYPEKQRKFPAELFGSWDPDTAVLNGGRIFSTAMSILTLESYYRFSPLLGDEPAPPDVGDGAEKKPVPPPAAKPGDKKDGK